MKSFRIALVLFFVFLAVACPKRLQAQTAGNSVVPYVDLSKYLGLWYEIARYDAWFQKNALASTAHYSLRKDGNIKVVNTLWKKSNPSETQSAVAKAWVFDKKTNAKLKVEFFWPFAGDYWIIQLGENYEYAVVGSPKKDYLWILCRKPVMDEAVYNKILAKLVEQGYDINKLIKDVPQVK